VLTEAPDVEAVEKGEDGRRSRRCGSKEETERWVCAAGESLPVEWAEEGSRCSGILDFFLAGFLRPVEAPDPPPESVAVLRAVNIDIDPSSPATAPIISLEATGAALFFLGLLLFTASAVISTWIAASRLVSPVKSLVNSTLEAVHSPFSFSTHFVLSIYIVDPLWFVSLFNFFAK
jgi:hypothetical protein